MQSSFKKTLPAYCIPKVVRMETRDVISRKKTHVTSASTKDLFETRMEKRISFRTCSATTSTRVRKNTVYSANKEMESTDESYSNTTFAQSSETRLHGTLPDMQFAIQQLFTQVLNPTTESKRAVKQLIRYRKGTRHTCLRLEPRASASEST